MTTNNPTLLMVDDNPADVELARLMIEELDAPLQFHDCASGEEAINFLEAVPKSAGKKPADYMFLDLNMPGMSGFDLLRTIRSRKEYDQLHVVVLTSSAFQGKVDQAYKMGANVVVTKPSSVQDYKEILADIQEYWTEAAAAEA